MARHRRREERAKARWDRAVETARTQGRRPDATASAGRPSATSGPAPGPPRPPIRLAWTVAGVFAGIALFGLVLGGLNLVFLDIYRLISIYGADPVLLGQLAEVGGISGWLLAFSGTLQLAAVPLFIAWQVQMRRLVERLDIDQPRWSPLMHALWWLVPPTNLWRPYQAVSDLERVLRADADHVPWDRRPSSLILRWWWFSLLVSFGATAATAFYDLEALSVWADADIQRRLGLGGLTMATYRTATMLDLVADLIRALGAVFAVLVVWRLTRMAHARMADTGAPTAAG